MLPVECLRRQVAPTQDRGRTDSLERVGDEREDGEHLREGHGQQEADDLKRPHHVHERKLAFAWSPWESASGFIFGKSRFCPQGFRQAPQTSREGYRPSTCPVNGALVEMIVSHATPNRLFSNCQGELAFDHVSAEGSQTVRALQSELWAILESERTSDVITIPPRGLVIVLRRPRR